MRHIVQVDKPLDPKNGGGHRFHHLPKRDVGKGFICCVAPCVEDKRMIIMFVVMIVMVVMVMVVMMVCIWLWVDMDVERVGRGVLRLVSVGV